VDTLYNVGNKGWDLHLLDVLSVMNCVHQTDWGGGGNCM
jgi:hypothetical protein